MSLPNNDYINQPKKVWATLLTKENEYILGAKVLAHSLLNVKSKFPLVIIHTDALSSKTLNAFRENFGCITRKIAFLDPPSTVTKELRAGYRETWTKLRVWELEEYERVVLLDADMLVVQNMDELLEEPLENGWILASSACTCNPMQLSHYPKDWIPESCAYTNDITLTKSGGHVDYFNSGLLVLSPSLREYARIENSFRNHPNPSSLLFPDQDFLNEIFCKKWKRLSYKYNALKTLRKCHAPIWNDNEVKNVHYILQKPWEINKEEKQVRDDPAYQLNQWWWAMEENMKEKYIVSKVVNGNVDLKKVEGKVIEFGTIKKLQFQEQNIY
ncbi:hypothetical protein G9A89_002177 [Geosiphon pyriformis]|nr:hypothetical protein G9A89_002177 [Geosiphon pyriformis]